MGGNAGFSSIGISYAFTLHFQNVQVPSTLFGSSAEITIRGSYGESFAICVY